MVLRIVGTLLLVAVPLAANGQITLGARGGLNLSSLRGDDVEDLDGKTGFHFGAFADFSLSDVFSIQPEILLSQKGAEESEQGVTASINLSYAEIPVLAKIKIPSSGKVGGHVVAGPAIAFETKCEVEVEGDGASAAVDCDADELEGDFDRKTLDLGLLFGGGMSVDVGGVVLSLETRYNLGILDLNDDPSPDVSAVRNGNLMFTVGVGIPLPR